MSIWVVLGVVFAAWHYVLFCGFVSDDHACCEQRKDIIPDEEKNPKKEHPVVKAFNDGIVMWAWTTAMVKLKMNKIAWLWHAQVLCVHILNVWLVSIVLSGIIGKEAAFAAALLWGINPMQNQAVAWISGRPYTTGTLLALVCIYFWKQVWLFPVYVLAVMTNISIAFMPVIMKLMYPHAWQPTAYITIMMICGFPYILWKFYKRFTQALVIDRENFQFKIRRINVLSKIYGYYILSLVAPINMGWYHQSGFRYNKRWEKINFWTVVSACLIIWLSTQGVPGWFFILGILPNANLYATNSFVSDRYVYFGSIGLAVIAAKFLIHHPIIFWCVVTFYVTKTYSYTRHLVDDEKLYRKNLELHPKSDYAANNLAYFLIQQQRWDEARCLIHRTFEDEETKANKMLWYNLALTWAAQGHLRNDAGKMHYIKALDCWKACLRIEPRWEKPANDIKKMTQFLIDNKVLTLKEGESANGLPTIELPSIKGLPQTDDNTKTGAAEGCDRTNDAPGQNPDSAK